MRNIGFSGRGGTGERRWAAGLAMLALLVQVLVPQGFMVARQGDRPAIVVCSGHGPAMSGADMGGHPAKSPKSKPDMVCGFAGHGLGLALSVAPLVGAPTRLLQPSRDPSPPPPGGPRAAPAAHRSRVTRPCNRISAPIQAPSPHGHAPCGGCSPVSPPARP